MPRAVTIRDVAQRAGVSRQTVSRAMNNKADITPETRQRVLEVARELGYRPSSIAQGLKTQHTRTIGLVVPDIANPFFAEVARGASEVAHSQSYGVFLCNTDEHPERELDILRLLEAHRVEGIVLASSRLEDEALAQVAETWRPLVLVNRCLSPNAGAGCVLVDDAGAAREATRHLLERGHRRIGFLAGSLASHSSQERRAGYKDALREAGLAPEPAWCVSCAPTAEGGHDAALALLADHAEITALLGYNDLVALGALRACRSLGWPVPQRCALVGWDDIPFASYVSPPLTTMRMPKHQIGAQAMAMLFALLGDPEQSPEPVVLSAELVARGSS
jgi:LacI family transcriptional regulator